MEDLSAHFRVLMMNGNCCSQTIVHLSIEIRGIEDPLLMNSMRGLYGGMFAQSTCRTLNGD